MTEFPVLVAGAPKLAAVQMPALALPMWGVLRQRAEAVMGLAARAQKPRAAEWAKAEQPAQPAAEQLRVGAAAPPDPAALPVLEVRPPPVEASRQVASLVPRPGEALRKQPRPAVRQPVARQLAEPPRRAARQLVARQLAVRRRAAPVRLPPFRRPARPALQGSIVQQFLPCRPEAPTIAERIAKAMRAARHGHFGATV